MITTMVGSYPKIGPNSKAPNLRAAIGRFDRGLISQDELRNVEEQVTTEIIQDQAQAGIDLVTDGQVRWDDGQTYFAGRIDGFSINGLIRYFDTNTYYRQPVAHGPLRWREPIALDDFRLAVANSPRPVKQVITGPYTLARLSRSDHHSDLTQLVTELAEVLNQEARELEANGATVIQFDEPAILKHPEDYHLFCDAMARLTRDLRATLCLYTYFGGIASLGAGFFDLPFHVFGLDFVMGPANWGSLNQFPADRSLALGIVDARNTRLETVEELVESVRRVVPFVSLDRIYLNPSCGLEFLPRDVAYNKLALLVEAARRAQEVL